MGRKRMVPINDENKKYAKKKVNFENKNEKCLKKKVNPENEKLLIEEVAKDKKVLNLNSFPPINKEDPIEMLLGYENVPIKKISEYLKHSLNKTRELIEAYGIGKMVLNEERRRFECPAYLVYRMIGYRYEA